MLPNVIPLNRSTTVSMAKFSRILRLIAWKPRLSIPDEPEVEGHDQSEDSNQDGWGDRGQGY